MTFSPRTRFGSHVAFDDAMLVDLARRYGTPTYVYDLDGMVDAARELDVAFGSAPHLTAYAVKANSAGPILQRFAALGLGADVVTGPELRLARAAGVPARRIVFSGVAKSDDELALAVREDLLAVQIESLGELQRLALIAEQLGARARVSIRINPGLDDLDTHAHVKTGHDEAKFGVALGRLDRCVEAALHSPWLQLVGVACHVGSQFASTREYLEGARIVMDVAARVNARTPLEFVDTGGGFGIDYGGRPCAPPADFVRAALAEKATRPELGGLALHVEPGRCLVGAHGALLARTIGDKTDGTRHWLMVDAGMNDLMRPALYQAEHRVEGVYVDEPPAASRSYRVVGPICESSDDFGAHVLSEPPPPWVVLRDAGAYGYTMASRYNGRALAAEVFVSEGRVVAAQEREPEDAWVAARLAFATFE